MVIFFSGFSRVTCLNSSNFTPQKNTHIDDGHHSKGKPIRISSIKLAFFIYVNESTFIYNSLNYGKSCKSMNIHTHTHTHKNKSVLHLNLFCCSFNFIILFFEFVVIYLLDKI